ncbi:UDP-glucose dehydrogenase family protein [Lichenifustis flavocetrariae]|uniref:UDP-glucose 6-dehydrogenase n=1 Tax=Lichenifustis flavocetrariae TaxID=2949735 RepID=A0AA42CHM9_9HYPH|nr:UDP-glucose/GDP-mannose dehydrogenase family protein [Lichenifustis flavocetrariae]MCW6507713.1 UDP-glucose/GDP-mannose dehydrogenase family protein [Lichenifustis flavocetrariae]
MRLAVVGTGYVGLVSGVCLAARDHDVTCVDINPSIVSRLNAGEPTIYEKGLPELLERVIQAGRFRATTKLHEALDTTDLVLISVGTPSENGVIDLRYVLGIAREIGEYIRDHDRHISVVVKSTVVPGTTDTAVRKAIEEASGKGPESFGLGMNPEFLREGEAIEDFAYPDRIVLGHEDPQTLARLEELYAPWAVDKVRVNTRTAELIKYANNALLATQISAINEIANLAAALGGIDVMDVVKGVHLDKRWNPITENGRAAPAILAYLVPGCGFGGSCFPKDVQALRSQGVQQGLPMRMMNAVLDVNDLQPAQVTDIVAREIGDLRGKRVVVLGLAFKPNTDDVRESASLKIVRALLDQGADVSAHDPIAVDHFRRAFGDDAAKVKFVEDWQAAARAAEVVIVATSWADYKPLAELGLADTVLFDARRMFRPAQFESSRYLTIGRRVA